MSTGELQEAVELRSLLSATQLKQVLRPQHVVNIKDSASVDQTLRVLAAHRILSAPVVVGNSGEAGVPPPAGADKAPEVCGFIDIRDLLSSFLHEIDLKALADAKMLKRMRILEEQGARFAGKCIKDLRSLGSDGWFYPQHAAESTSLREIIHDGFLHPKETKRSVFGGTRSRQVVHRLALFDAEGHLSHVISQSDVIKYLYDHIDEMGPLAEASITKIGFVKGQVISVRPETPALDAMVLMEEKSISAVAVVNAQGAIIGNFSISELRTIMAEHFGSLALPVGEFLALEHGTEYAGYAIPSSGSSPSSSNAADELKRIEDTQAHKFASDRSMRRRESHPGYEVGQTLITCSPNASLHEVLDKIVANRLHRVYVCNEQLMPCGVVTLTDILHKLVEA
ncbi:E3 ubiquitin-ligase [Micractinium conductrix]|uniref:E3 ubiquitin-ligase n=1 Tax=Micractinium conductrix TaxID=554055 RepID=A0A2P6UZX0_9CHLO|nr:E3 ubiquitin-ligase [Micractinium conductrix]|eukprot:PSC67382.1 E3 ubiquitin-ligase [Micractinium conductrix]